MATFPLLKTGAVAQHPLELTTRFKTQAVQFLDGSRQSYALGSRGLRRWRIELDLLDDCEMAALISFVEQQQGASFSFYDPISSSSVANCVVAEDSFELTYREESRGRAALVVEEVA